MKKIASGRITVNNHFIILAIDLLSEKKWMLKTLVGFMPLKESIGTKKQNK